MVYNGGLPHWNWCVGFSETADFRNPAGNLVHVGRLEGGWVPEHIQVCLRLRLCHVISRLINYTKLWSSVIGKSMRKTSGFRPVVGMATMARPRVQLWSSPILYTWPYSPMIRLCGPAAAGRGCWNMLKSLMSWLGVKLKCSSNFLIALFRRPCGPFTEMDGYPAVCRACGVGQQ